MSVSRRQLLLGSSSAVLLTACGGGGGDSGSGDPGGSGGSWLAFSPQPVTVDVMEGTSTTFSVTATSSRTIADTLFVKIVDAQAVTTGFVGIVQNSTTVFTATLEVSPALAVGSHDGELEVGLYTDAELTKPYEGSPWRVAYQITVGARHAVHRLLADRQSIALAAFPSVSASVLSAEVRVTDNQGKATPWTAASSQDWLKVTERGTTSDGSDVITLTADPSGLPADQVSYAIVTLSSTDSSVKGKESIRVGLWRGASEPTAHALTIDTLECVADRAAPLVYSHARGSHTIDVVHVYRGLQVATLDAGSGAKLGKMATSTDAKRLFAVDLASKSVVVFDLLSRTRIATWPVSGIVNDDTPIAYLRPNGIGVLAFGKVLLSADTGEAFAAELPEPSVNLVASPLGDALYGSDFSRTLRKWSIDFIDYNDIGPSVEQTLERRYDAKEFPVTNVIALSPDGSALYSKSVRARTTDFSVEGRIPEFDPESNDIDAILDEVTTGSDGRLYATYDGGSMVVYSATGTKLARLSVSVRLWRPRVSPDGLMCTIVEEFFHGTPAQLRIEPFLP